MIKYSKITVRKLYLHYTKTKQSPATKKKTTKLTLNVHRSTQYFHSSLIKALIIHIIL